MKLNLSHTIYITVIVVIVFAFSIFYMVNPKTIEHNNTIEIIKEIEVIKEIEKECPVCPVCDASIKCNESECPYSRGYVLSLIRQAKKCEKSEYHYDLDECIWRYNRTDRLLDNCTADLDECEEGCEDYCVDVAYDEHIYETKFDNCTTNFNVCKDELDECDDDLENCRDTCPD